MDRPGCSNWQNEPLPEAQQQQPLVPPHREEAVADDWKQATLRKCVRTPYLDGHFFRVDEDSCAADGTIAAICQLCPREKIIRGVATSSTNFRSHLKRNHREVYTRDYELYAAAKRLKLSEEHGSLKGRRATCVFSQARFERNVAEYILHSMAPFSTVEMPAFRKIFDDLQIKLNDVPLKHISRRRLVRTLNAVFESDVTALKQTLRTVQYVCTTADVWSCSARRFLGVTVHWIDPVTYARRSAAIACRRFAGAHTYDRIFEMLSAIHESFGISDKIVSTITDNASNFVKAFKEFGLGDHSIVPYEADSTTDGASDTASTVSDVDDRSESDFSDEEEEGQAFSQQEPCEIIIDIDYENNLPRHFRCVCHTLNLVATTDVTRLLQLDEDASLQHGETIRRCGSLWRTLGFPKQREQLTAILGQALTRPVVVRWNSLYNALRQIHELKARIIEASIRLNIDEQLVESDFLYIGEYLQALKPMADTIEKLQGEKYCFYGCVTPSLVSLKRQLLRLHTSNNLKYYRNIVKELASSIELRFSDYFAINGNGEFAAVAAVLHPRFKKLWVSTFSQACKTKVETAVTNAVSGLGIRRECPAVDLDDEDFFNFDAEETQDMSAPNDSAVLHREYLKYLHERPTNSVKAWDAFPSLKDVFLYFNTPLPSSAPVERLFSYATMMSVPKYNRLTDEQFEMRVLAKCNSAINKN